MTDRPTFAHDFLRRLQRARQDAGRSKLRNAELPEFQLDALSYSDEAAAAAAAANDANGTNSAAAENGGSSDVDLLVSHSQPTAFRIGTGASIFTQALIPAILSARSEVLLVTCFWAPSKSLSAISRALLDLAVHRHDLNQDRRARGQPELPRLRVRICLSSRSLLQKLLHPASRDGYVYPPATWTTQLGLPEPSLLESGGIDLHAKSIFFLPFSIMHPKFVIIDRTRALVPSCNVSWEPWLEACVEFSGPAVRGLLAFYARTWEPGLELGQAPERSDESDTLGHVASPARAVITSTADTLVSYPETSQPIPTIILPSSHHRNPLFRPFPWQKHPEAPPTPLNVAILQLLASAKHRIYLHTPNLTSWPVMFALLDALRRGVDVTVITNRDMMVWEQLLTAGTTSAWCMQSFIRQAKGLTNGGRTGASRGEQYYDALDRLEAQNPPLGTLCVSYYHARAGSKTPSDPNSPALDVEEPVLSHVKLTIVDGRYTVLGSGNMDRASWFTSQELGVLFDDAAFAQAIQERENVVLTGRLELAFDSGRA